MANPYTSKVGWRGRDSKTAYMESLPPENVGQFGFHRGQGNLGAAVGQGLEYLGQARSNITGPTTPMSRANEKMMNSLLGAGVTKKITNLGEYKKKADLEKWYKNDFQEGLKNLAKEMRVKKDEWFKTNSKETPVPIGSKWKSPKGTIIEVTGEPFMMKKDSMPKYKTIYRYPNGDVVTTHTDHKWFKDFLIPMKGPQK